MRAYALSDAPPFAHYPKLMEEPILGDENEEAGSCVLSTKRILPAVVLAFALIATTCGRDDVLRKFEELNLIAT